MTGEGKRKSCTKRTINRQAKLFHSLSVRSGNPFSPALPLSSPSQYARFQIALRSPSKRRFLSGLAAFGNFRGICTWYAQRVLCRTCGRERCKTVRGLRWCAQDSFKSKSLIQALVCTMSTSMTCGGIHQQHWRGDRSDGAHTCRTVRAWPH